MTIPDRSAHPLKKKIEYEVGTDRKLQGDILYHIYIYITGKNTKDYSVIIVL